MRRLVESPRATYHYVVHSLRSAGIVAYGVHYELDCIVNRVRQQIPPGVWGGAEEISELMQKLYLVSGKAQEPSLVDEGGLEGTFTSRC